jgi:hypothetical protein
MAKVKQKLIGRSKLEFTNNLPEFLSDKERLAAKVITQGTMLILTEASYRTPIDTNNLMNSYQRKIEQSGTKVTGTVFNTAEYAAYVHDPAVKQTFKRDSAVKEFLKVGGDSARPMIDTLLKKALKV